MKLIIYLSTIFFTLTIVSCDRKKGQEYTDNVEDKTKDNSKDSVTSSENIPDLDSLNHEIAKSIQPLFPNIDTLILNDGVPLYCGNASEEEISLDYFPINENPKYFEGLNSRLGKVVLLKSKIYRDNWDLFALNKVQLRIEGKICSKDTIIIAESYIYNFEFCDIKKCFIYSKGKWTYKAEPKQCWTPKK